MNFFSHLNSCAMPFDLCVIKFARLLLNYSPVIQIKLYIFRQRNDRKNSAISTFKK